MELAGEAEKLAKRLHPRDEEAAERHAIDSFLGALNRSLAAEVQKFGCRTMEEVLAAARLQNEATNLVHAGPNLNPHEGLKKRSRANGIPIDGRYPYRCACCSATPCRLTACHGHCSPTSYRSATPASYRATACLPTCLSNVSGLRGRGTIFSATTPTAR